MIPTTTVESSKSTKDIPAVVSSTPPHSPTLTSSKGKDILSEGKTSVVEHQPQNPGIWEWGVDETLWNPDRTRYAGRLPPLSPLNDSNGGVLTKEVVDKIHEWFERDSVMTEAEREQRERAMEAFRKSAEPIDDETLYEVMRDCCD